MTLLRDLRYAARSLAITSGYAATVVATLAVGIGANTAVFSVVYAVLLQPLPFSHPDRLVRLVNVDAEQREEPILLRDFEAWESRARSFESMTVFYRNTGFSRVTLTQHGEPESAQGAFVSSAFFDLLGVPPQIGRVFSATETTRRDLVLVLSDSLWRRGFGANPNAVGGTIQVDGSVYSIVGVMPADLRFPASDTQFWAPITTNRFWDDRPPPDDIQGRGFFARWNAVGRLRPGVSLDQAQAELDVIADSLQAGQPSINDGLSVRVLSLRVDVDHNSRRALWILLGAISLVLLVGCANVGGLLLTRMASRGRELAVRAALGASQSQLVAVVLAESVILVSVATLLGIAFAAAGVQALVAFGPSDLPRLSDAGLNRSVLAYVLTLSALTALLSSGIPTWMRIRGDVTASPGSLERSSFGSLALSRVRSLIVIGEFAITIVLLTGAGLLIRSLLAVDAVDPGFRAEHALSAHISLPAGTNDSGFYDRVLTRLEELPGVEAAGSIDGLFDLSDPDFFGLRAVEGRDLKEPSGRWTAPLRWHSVGGSYFRSMGAALILGRLFSEEDRPGSPLVAVIDESMARRYWPDESPIGKRFKGWDQRGTKDEWLSVIGVVGDMRRHGLERESSGHIYEWSKQSGERTPDLVVRTSVEPASATDALRSAIRETSSVAIIGRVATLESQLNEQTTPQRFRTWLLSLFAALGVVLATVGLYGVMHDSVVRRTREIGIRRALGAQAVGILITILGNGLKLALLGLATGLVASWWVAQLLSNLLYGVTPTDPSTFVGAVLLLTVVATAASLAPALRATRVDPMVALRHE